VQWWVIEYDNNNYNNDNDEGEGAPDLECISEC